MNCSQTSHCILTTVGCFIYDFQTLITGAVAIGVAIAAGIPVWRQLKDTNLQTRISHRETLALLMRDALARFAKVEKAMREPLSMADQITSYPDGEPTEIEAEGAHHLEQTFNGVIDWYLVVLAETEHEDIESCKVKLKEAIDALVSTLGDAHWTDHNFQQDEDHNIPDAEWAEIVARCAAAKIEASARVGDVSQAYRALVSAQQAWVRSLRVRIANSIGRSSRLNDAGRWIEFGRNARIHRRFADIVETTGQRSSADHAGRRDSSRPGRLLSSVARAEARRRPSLPTRHSPTGSPRNVPFGSSSTLERRYVTAIRARDSYVAHDIAISCATH